MAGFRTAYLQKEVILDVAVKGAVVGEKVIKVCDLVKLTNATATVPATLEKVTSLAAATHIVAQSDTTLEYGHVPIERRNYLYEDTVAATFVGTAVENSPVKKVAVFLITDRTDVMLSAGETA